MADQELSYGPFDDIFGFDSYEDFDESSLFPLDPATLLFCSEQDESTSAPLVAPVPLLPAPSLTPALLPVPPHLPAPSLPPSLLPPPLSKMTAIVFLQRRTRDLLKYLNDLRYAQECRGQVYSGFQDDASRGIQAKINTTALQLWSLRLSLIELRRRVGGGEPIAIRCVDVLLEKHAQARQAFNLP